MRSFYFYIDDLRQLLKLKKEIIIKRLASVAFATQAMQTTKHRKNRIFMVPVNKHLATVQIIIFQL
jgi:hypothetical protein